MTKTHPRAGVIGWPVAHSRSPIIHRSWLDAYGIDGSYDLIPVPPQEIASFLANFADSGFVGANVTLPHKEAAFAAVGERCDPAARALGAVNTIWLEDGLLYGANTDVTGFLANLDTSAPGWDRDAGPALVLGAGGAARAIVHGLASRGFAPIHVVNRTEEKAEAVAAQFPGVARAAAWSNIALLVPTARIIVNTTSLGMKGQPDLVIDLSRARPDAVVSDTVYVPLETPLLREARRNGLVAVDGLGMLLHQAVPGFARWFGVTPKVTPELRDLILSDLGVAA
ncbi:Shikimate dehydrogenase [Hartmannibacter diazotrophicus]|uniref:Shikimate dehydrogenase (NADP(+)) n=1 Tax=Hartmannibacter diazotrophicus TaxID=1482074 RepID=A0A2C9DE91_9HYPH|nr:shikimate dehydrogenase [Hartmannibacter diazotrophicus]SON58191.1 Shikimate dehydrogenase [Hartmannibacter diazotrophicus]